MGMYTSDMRQYRALLNKEMALAAWTEVPFWKEFLGFIGNGEGRYPKSVAMGSAFTKTLKPTGKPIEMLTNFEHEGGVTMDIPVAYPLTEKPVYGDKQLLGTEEGRKIAYKTVHINQVRKGTIIKDGFMSEAVLSRPAVQKELMNGAQGELTDLNQRWNAYQPYNALLYRYSENIFAPKVDGGLAAVKQSHPNFYVAGSGKVTFHATPATYEGNIATALTSLTDTASDHFSTSTIENMVYYASRHKIKPTKIGANGAPFYHIVINPAQAIQLLQDDKWLVSQKALAQAGSSSALFSGQVMGEYRGAIIWVDQNCPDIRKTGDTASANGMSLFTDAYSTTGTSAGVQYGNYNPLADPIATGSRKLAILFGASAIACGYASPLTFMNETWDYENKKTEGSKMVVGFERSDIYDIDGFFGTAGFLENTSSLVCATWSPDSVAW